MVLAGVCLLFVAGAEGKKNENENGDLEQTNQDDHNNLNKPSVDSPVGFQDTLNRYVLIFVHFNT